MQGAGTGQEAELGGGQIVNFGPLFKGSGLGVSSGITQTVLVPLKAPGMRLAAKSWLIRATVRPHLTAASWIVIDSFLSGY